MCSSFLGVPAKFTATLYDGTLVIEDDGKLKKRAAKRLPKKAIEQRNYRGDSDMRSGGEQMHHHAANIQEIQQRQIRECRTAAKTKENKKRSH